MRFIGIDIGSEKHFYAVVDVDGQIVLKSTSFMEDDVGYAKLLAALGSPDGALVAMEATGHYWQNLFGALTAAGFAIALLNPLRTARFAAEDLRRAKTDAIDALGIARFAQQKRPAATKLTEEATLELRELVRHRDRLVQELGDHVRQLHRLVDLGFPELTRLIKDLSSALATTVLTKCPTARAFDDVTEGELANMRYDGRHAVGRELAGKLIASAKRSVGAHHGPAYRLQVEHACEDIESLKRRIGHVEGRIGTALEQHEVGKLLTTIDGIGETTAAKLVAELGDIASFESGDAIAAYVGVVPGIKHSGKHAPLSQRLSPIGHAELRAKLYMPTIAATKYNPWLRRFYERLRAAGKPAKVAIVAAMRKLLHAVYSVAKNRRPFTPILPSNAEVAT
jgi:transposase